MAQSITPSLPLPSLPWDMTLGSRSGTSVLLLDMDTTTPTTTNPSLNMLGTCRHCSAPGDALTPTPAWHGHEVGGMMHAMLSSELAS
jgi:hypothetical protein